MYLKKHQKNVTDFAHLPSRQLAASISEYLVGRHHELIDTVKQLPVLAIVREPLVRFLASYKDKIQRTSGRQFYYNTITARILDAKYPNSAIPSSQHEWEMTKTKTGLVLTFQNMIEHESDRV